jgi:hypothetical protein
MRIRSGATVVALYDGALKSMLHSAAAVCTGGDFCQDLLGMAIAAKGEKP